MSIVWRLGGVQGYFTRLHETGLYIVSDEDSKQAPLYGKEYFSTSKKHANEWGLFVQDEWNITPKLTVVPGLRLDSHSSGEKYDIDKELSDKSFEKQNSAFPSTSFSATTFNPRFAVKYEVAKNSKIKTTSPFVLVNCRASKRLGVFTIYAGGKNIFSYIQDEKHLDDAAFMYAPVYGATWYAGVSIKL